MKYKNVEDVIVDMCKLELSEDLLHNIRQYYTEEELCCIIEINKRVKKVIDEEIIKRKNYKNTKPFDCFKE